MVPLQSIPYGEPIPANWPDLTKQLMDDEVRGVRGLEGVESDVSYGEPSEELAQFSQDLNVLTVGLRSYGPLRQLVNGSVSNYLADRSRSLAMSSWLGAVRSPAVRRRSTAEDAGTPRALRLRANREDPLPGRVDTSLRDRVRPSAESAHGDRDRPPR